MFGLVSLLDISKIPWWSTGYIHPCMMHILNRIAHVFLYLFSAMHWIGLLTVALCVICGQHVECS